MPWTWRRWSSAWRTAWLSKGAGWGSERPGKPKTGAGMAPNDQMAVAQNEAGGGQTAGFGPCVHLPIGQVPFWNSGFLSHTQMSHVLKSLW